MHYHYKDLLSESVFCLFPVLVEKRHFSHSISKINVQNSNSKISARPNLATNLLQILIIAYGVKQGNLYLSFTIIIIIIIIIIMIIILIIILIIIISIICI